MIANIAKFLLAQLVLCYFLIFYLFFKDIFERLQKFISFPNFFFYFAKKNIYKLIVNNSKCLISNKRLRKYLSFVILLINGNFVIDIFLKPSIENTKNI